MNRRVVLLALCVGLLLVGTASAWYDGAWNYRKSFTINNTGSNLTDYQLMFTINRSTGSDANFTVYLNNKCEADYDDIRFIGADDTTAWDYWVESNSSTVATIWVEVPSIPNSTAYGSVTGYLYYGNSGASAASNGTNTFEFFDDFLGSSLDTGIWDSSGSPTIVVSGGTVTITATAAAQQGIYSKTTFGGNYIARGRWKEATMTSISYPSFGFSNTGATRQLIIFAYADGSNKFSSKTNNGATTVTQIKAPLDTDWHILEVIRISTTSVKFYFDSNTHTISTTIPSDSLPVGVYAYGTPNSAVCDWVLVRKYAATEPTISTWGSEEEQFPKYLTVDFSGVPTSGYVPLTVYFTDASIGYNVTLNTWAWSFGDSSANSTQQNPAHTYTTSGPYNVILTVTNTSFSKTNTTQKTAYINVTVNPDAPNADFTVTETCGETSDTFYFIDFSTGGGLYAWNWSFGDGSYSELRNPTHQYAGNGTYDVNLTVWGAYGVDSLLRSNLITIPCGAPTPTPTATVTPTETHTHIYGNISVYKVDSNYIVWRVSENVTSMCLDGEIVDVFGEYYGQYHLEPNTKHFACINTNECMSVITPDNGITVFGNWIIYLILIAACIIAVRVPILGTFPVVFGMYLITVYLPDIGATFAEYSLVGILVIMGIICAIIGFRRI